MEWDQHLHQEGLVLVLQRQGKPIDNTEMRGDKRGERERERERGGGGGGVGGGRNKYETKVRHFVLLYTCSIECFNLLIITTAI